GLQYYIPYCLLPIYARRNQRAISIAHFAQSLDGRIATNTGDSRWIGNDQNLIHAHRMRALCNGILVGNNTISADQPKLTVRRVEGKNPVRVVLGSSRGDYTSLFQSCEEPVLLLSSAPIKSNGRVRTFQLESQNGKIKSGKILELLFRQGIYSVYIEGGAITTSNFINDRAVDILQLHFSPLLFGSGKTGVVLPEISEVRKAIQFEDFHYQPIGNTIMFVGQIDPA
ncbi:MAG: RibD family protein, partial [Bacteroidota bacterium]